MGLHKDNGEKLIVFKLPFDLLVLLPFTISNFKFLDFVWVLNAEIPGSS